jgi:[ribosomal protein S5]-alanine N-acetyltransferase
VDFDAASSNTMTPKTWTRDAAFECSDIKMNDLNYLRTPRLVLTRMCVDDLDDLVRMYADPHVMATLGGVRSAEWTADYLDKQIAHWEQHGFGFWTLREPVTQSFVGRGGLRHVILDGQVEIEVGYGLMSEFWGRGLATELAVESVRVGFEELHLPSLVCFTLTTNVASRCVMENAGFRYERDMIYAELPHVLFRQNCIE